MGEGSYALQAAESEMSHKWVWFEDWRTDQLIRLLDLVDTLEGYDLDMMLKCVLNKDQFSLDILDENLDVLEGTGHRPGGVV